MTNSFPLVFETLGGQSPGDYAPFFSKESWNSSENFSKSKSTETVAAGDQGICIHLVNHLSPGTSGISGRFVYDLASNQGGWGGGRITLLSGHARRGLSKFIGSRRARELGQVRFYSTNHSSSPSKLIFEGPTPKWSVRIYSDPRKLVRPAPAPRAQDEGIAFSEIFSSKGPMANL